MDTPLAARLCPRCPADAKRPCRPGQRLCGNCHARYKRDRRRQQAANATTGNVVVGSFQGPATPRGPAPASATGKREGNAVPPFVPFLGVPDAAIREPWWRPFLEHLSENGSVSLAAAYAGVHRTTVTRHRAAHPEFDAEVDVASAYYRELVEWQSLQVGRTRDNPLPFFARLKAEMPTRYIDKQAIAVYDATERDGAFSEDACRALLVSMLAVATQSTHAKIRELAGGKTPVLGAGPDIIDAEPA